MIFDTTTRLPTYNNCGFVVKGRNTPKESITENIVASENIIDNPVSVYPNPVHDKLQLTLKSAEPAKVLLYSVNGHMLYETSARPGNNQLDLQFLPTGYYIIKVTNAKINTTLRLVKQ